ncbi:hypothetical protein [Nostoc favosum]|nr:hypothetical protein [Nostoc favosum]
MGSGEWGRSPQSCLLPMPTKSLNYIAIAPTLRVLRWRTRRVAAMRL